MDSHSSLRFLNRMVLNGNIQESIKMIDEMPEISPEIAVMKTKLYVILEQFEESNGFIDTYFSSDNPKLDKDDLARGMMAKAFNYVNEGKIQEAEMLLAESEEQVIVNVPYFHELLLKQKSMLLEWYYAKAFLMRKNGNPSKALEYLNVILPLIDDEAYHKLPLMVGRIFNETGAIYYFIGKINEAEEYWKEGYLLRTKYGNQYELANSINNLATLSIKVGDLHTAETYLLKCLEIYKEIRAKGKMARIYNNLGLVYESKHELDKAETYTHMALSINTSLGNIIPRTNNLINLSKIYLKKGKFSESEELLLKVLNILGSDRQMILEGEALLILITLYLEKKDKNSAIRYFKRLDELNHKTRNGLMKFRRDLAKALISRFSDRIIAQAEAQMRFREIIEDPDVPSDIQVIAYIHLSDLLLQELRSIEDKSEVLTELNILTENLQGIAFEYPNYSLLVQVLILKSKLAMIDNDLEHSKLLIDQAIEVANKNSLPLSREKAQAHLSSLQHEVQMWDRILKQNSSLVDRIEESDVINYMKEVVRKYEL